MVGKFEKDIEGKLDKNDASRIWKYFERFARYDDLKDLYNKCIPSIAKVE